MKKTLFFLNVMAVFFCISCSQDDFDSPSPPNAEPQVSARQNIGLSPEVTNLQTSDAEIVANLFTQRDNPSRSGSKTIKNIVTIPNSSGTPTLYAVNYEDGYIIVPATKNLAPILAIVDHGNYSLEDTPSGRDVIISQLIAESDYWQANGGNKNHKDEWRLYTRYPSEIPSTESRSNELDDPWNVLYATLYEFEDKGYECYRITKFEEDQDIMPDAILQQFKRTARFEDNIWEDEYGEDFMYETSLIVIRYETVSNIRTQCLKTTWSQDYPYNSMIGGINPLGCVTIATGQIMNYHQYPTSFNWTQMPNALSYGGSNTLTDFLAVLHDKLGVNDTGGASINDAERVLKSYGYKVEQKTHTTGSYSSFPTYCRGVSKDGNKSDGHAWVCDGQNSSSYASIYELYMFDNAYYPKFQYTVMDSDRQFHYSSTLYHMNWGWGSTSDGYFSDSNMKAFNGKDTYYYNHDRKDLIITKP